MSEFNPGPEPVAVTASSRHSMLSTPSPPRRTSINQSVCSFSSIPGVSSYPSPNAIPPRTSSTGTQNQNNPPPPHNPSRPVLRPVAESDWLGQNVRWHRKSSSAATLQSLSHCLGTVPFPTSPIMQPAAPPDPSRYASEDFNFIARKTWTEQKEKVVWGPYDYLISNPGKDFRAQLVAAFNLWLDVPPESLEIITRAVGMLHTGSLLIDDVEDGSLLRRGMPVAHAIFGTAQTINSANYIYFYALQELHKLKSGEAVGIYMDELLNLHRGQGMDLFWRDTLTCPTEEDYLEMVGNKTGGLFRLAIKLMQAESRSLTDCVELVNLLGLIYQIRDDYLNLSSLEYSNNKGLCEDLTEGKFSFPIIHSIRSDPSNLQMLNILKQKSTEEEVKRYAVKYMEGTGSFKYTRQVLAVLLERARKLTDQLDGGRGKSKGIHKILDKMAVS